jgi:uncharacterized protein YraI
MRNRRDPLLSAALGLVLGATLLAPGAARAGGCPTCAAGGAHAAPASQYVGAQAYAPAAGAAYGAVPNGLTMDIFCGQGSGSCNQRYQNVRRWAERRYVKKTGATYIPIDPYGARLAMSGPDYAYPEGAQVLASTPAPAAPTAPATTGPDPAAQPPAAPALTQP